MLLMVLAVVLYLVARELGGLRPGRRPGEEPQGRPHPDAHGQEDAAQEVRSRNIPDLEDMDREVKKHEAETSETMGAMESLRESK